MTRDVHFPAGKCAPVFRTVLVGRLDDTGDARHRGKVEAFGGHDGRHALDDSGIVVVRCGEKREEICYARFVKCRIIYNPGPIIYKSRKFSEF